MTKVNRPEVKAAARTSIKGNIGIFFLAVFIFICINAAASFIPYAGSIAVFIAEGAFTLGFAVMALKMGRDAKIELKDLFCGFNSFGSAFFLSLLTGIFIILWSLLFLIPGIIACFRYSMAYFILADNPDMKAMAAIKKSKEIMKGRKWEFFVFELSFFGWYLLGMITLGFAYIYIGPYMEAAAAKFYDLIKNDTMYTSSPVKKIEEAPQA